jgi:hypothetical protein
VNYRQWESSDGNREDVYDGGLLAYGMAFDGNGLKKTAATIVPFTLL